MKPFHTETAYAAAIKIANVDTDMLIPKQFLKITTRSGLGKYLFNDLRYNSDGSAKKTFTLNTPPYNKAGFILAYDNFGCGSSREHAVWALTDFGIRAVIAPGFADIFAGNASKNGLLLIKLDKENIDELIADNKEPLVVDLINQVVKSARRSFAFEIPSALKNKLTRGLDDIGLTLTLRPEIDAYERAQKQKYPWR